MLLSEIFTLIFRRIHIVAVIFIATFLIVSQFDLIEKRYLLKRDVVIGEHLGSQNFPSLENLVGIINDNQFLDSINLGGVRADFEAKAARLYITFKGTFPETPETVVAASKIWMKGINKIEEDLFKEESQAIHDLEIDLLEKRINYFTNLSARIKSTEEMQEEVFRRVIDEEEMDNWTLTKMLSDNRELTIWDKLNQDKDSLMLLKKRKVFVPTRYFFDTDGKVTTYYPNKLTYIGYSLLASVTYLLSIIGLSYRKKKQSS
jgi:hypothetical protein